MSLLLCKKGAVHPFYNEKLDIRIWSMQELCYVIYNHPLMVLYDFVTPELCRWLREELSQGMLAGRIEQLLLKANGESGEETDEALVMILRECNYYTAGEAEACKRRIERLRNASSEDYAHAEGVSLFRLKRYRLAAESFRKEEALLAEQMRKTESERERGKLLQRRADVFCDLAAVRARMFDRKGALEFLSEADKLLPSARAARLRYFLVDAEDAAVLDSLSDEVKKELDMKREESRYRASSSQRMQELSDVFEQDPVKRVQQCTEIIRRWKREYRRQM